MRYKMTVKIDDWNKTTAFMYNIFYILYRYTVYLLGSWVTWGGKMECVDCLPCLQVPEFPRLIVWTGEHQVPLLWLVGNTVDVVGMPLQDGHVHLTHRIGFSQCFNSGSVFRVLDPDLGKSPGSNWFRIQIRHQIFKKVRKITVCIYYSIWKYRIPIIIKKKNQPTAIA